MPTPTTPVFYDGQPGPEIRRALNEMGALFVAAVEGAYGPQGWSPVLALEADGARRVFAIVDWTGGQGAKPTLTGYMGPAGIVATAAEAFDVRGPAGADALDAREIELQKSASHIQWRYVGDPTWIDLAALADLTGNDGREVELQATTTHIQWRYAGESWANLVALAALRGADGDAGWTPLVGLVADGERRVQRVVDWVGGAGPKPPTGQYVGAAGLTANIAEATDIRGAGGSGSGDMLAANNLSDLTNAPVARTNLGLGSAATRDVGTGAGAVAAGDDTRLSDARTPTGGAGGVLSGTYPNPGFAVDMATQAELDTVAGAKVDKVAGKQLSTEDYTTAEKTKLSGIASGATANATDAQLRDRASHTGAQAISTVTGLQAALDAKLGDAPTDGKTYGRKDGAWVEGGGSSGVLPDPRVINTSKTVNLAVAVAVAPGNLGNSVVVPVDANRELLVLVNSAGGVQACVYNKSTDTMGAVALLHATATMAVGVLVSADKVLIVCGTQGSTALQSMVLSLSGVSISVASPVNTTLAGNADYGSGYAPQLRAVGSSYVLSYARATNVTACRAITVSGTTPTVGAERVLSSGGLSGCALHPISSTVVLAIFAVGANLTAAPVSVSGTTLTLGTVASTANTGTPISLGPLSTGRHAVVYESATNVTNAAVISVSGTTASISTAVLASSAFDLAVSMLQGAAVVASGSGWAGIVADVGGVATAGTPWLNLGSSSAVPLASGIVTQGDVAQLLTPSSGQLVGAYVPSTASTSFDAIWPLRTRAIANQRDPYAMVGATTAFGQTNASWGALVTAAGAQRCTVRRLGSSIAFASDSEAWYAQSVSVANTVYQLTRASLPQ